MFDLSTVTHSPKADRVISLTRVTLKGEDDSEGEGEGDSEGEGEG